LLRFLQCLASSPQAGAKARWNVSLFHYRNYASDTGKVLCGIQVKEEERAAFDAFLQQLGFPFVEETNNPVYKQFLR
jgi:threonine dehydratase